MWNFHLQNNEVQFCVTTQLVLLPTLQKASFTHQHHPRKKKIFPYFERSETMASSMQSLQAFSWFLIHGCSKAWGAVILWSGSTTSSFFTKSEAKEDLQKYPVKYWWFGDETLRICVEKWDWSQDLSLSAGGPSRTNPQKKNALRRVSYPCVS